MSKLSEMPAGAKVRVTALKGDDRFLSRAASMGLTIGCHIEVLKNEGKQPILIYGRDTVVALNRKECEKIQVGGME